MGLNPEYEHMFEKGFWKEYDKGHYVVLRVNGVKWYTDYPDVESIMNFIVDMATKDKACIGFIRVGEEQGDTEEIGSPWNFDIYTETTIVFE